MSNSEIKIKKALVILMLFGICAECFNVSAQQGPPLSKNFVRAAQLFLWSLIPELSGKKYVMSLQAGVPYDPDVESLHTFGLKVGEGFEGAVIGESEKGEVHPKQFLQAWFSFNRDGQLWHVTLGGPVVGSPEASQEVRKLIQSHPEWTEAQAVAALESAGAKYGPAKKNEFVKKLPMEQLQELLEGKVTVESVEFNGLGKVHEGSFVFLEWDVEVKVSRGDGSEASYWLTFEPFKGQLTQLSLREGRSNAPLKR
jgi:hypothetical protein